jgi:hypothetical protein
MTPTVPRHNLIQCSIVVLVAAAIAAGLCFPSGWNFLAIAVCLTLLMIQIGRAIAGPAYGALINSLNIVSLARFQMAVWTILVLSAYLAHALARIKRGDGMDSMNVAIDSHLWILMGISTTSLVASPLILNTKKDQQPVAGVEAKTAAATGDSENEVKDNRQGIVYANTNKEAARLTDMFQGDEIGNTTQVDLAKVQMFYFTLIAGVAFFAAVFHNLLINGDLTRLPALSDGFFALLGISHAGYLGSKGVSHTPTQ